MTKPIKGIFENGVFRPLARVDRKEHQEVTPSVCHHTEDNLADLATLFFGDQGIELPPHPPVSVRQAPDFGE